MQRDIMDNAQLELPHDELDTKGEGEVVDTEPVEVEPTQDDAVEEEEPVAAPEDSASATFMAAHRQAKLGEVKMEGTLAQNLADIKAKNEELARNLESACATIERMKAQAEERENIIAEQQEEIKAVESRVEQIKASLANPGAFADAVAGEKEPAADSVGPDEPVKSLCEQLMAITDPNEKAKFRAANEQAIIEEQRQKRA